MNQNEIRPDDERPSLKERIGDSSIERGIPTGLNVKSKNTMKNVVFFALALIVAGIATAALLNYSGSSDEGVKQTEEEVVDGKAGSKNFKEEQDEILETVPAPASAADASAPAASEVNTASDIPPAVMSAASDIPPDERFDAGLSPLGMDEGTVSKTSAAAFPDGMADGAETGEADGGAPAPSGNPLTAKLRPGTYQSAVAENRGDLTYVLNRGTGIPCVTTTKIVTTHPGLTRCQVTRDVYSANGKTLLIERGSTIIGEQTSALTHGQARVFVLWNTLETPEGIRVALDSPGGDSLGASGHPAKVNYHFWQRFGGAILISVINDVATGLNNSQNRSSGNNNNITYENTSDAAQEMATEALKNSINIPPTGYVNQGTEIMIFVARDVDFSGVYENVTVSNRY
jgi:type IV secretion system protein virB10